MSYYLVYVKSNESLDFPDTENESRSRLNGFLKAAFGKYAYIDEEFGTGERSEFHAMSVIIPNANEDNLKIRKVLTEWLQEQCTDTSCYWFADDENPLYCPDGEYDGLLNMAIKQHYGALAL